LAKYYSTASKDPSTKVGAVLVNSRNRVVGLGYNGFPAGVEDTEERLNTREVKYELVVHGEMNAILEAGDKARGATLYVYPSFQLPPICANCAKHAIQAGIAAIVGFNPNENDERVKRWATSIAHARTMFQEAGIPWRAYDEEKPWPGFHESFGKETK
jgi:dCMP deaminase